MADGKICLFIWFSGQISDSSPKDWNGRVPVININIFSGSQLLFIPLQTPADIAVTHFAQLSWKTGNCCTSRRLCSRDLSTGSVIPLDARWPFHLRETLASKEPVLPLLGTILPLLGSLTLEVDHFPFALLHVLLSGLENLCSDQAEWCARCSSVVP